MFVHFLRSIALLARMHLVELLKSKRLLFAVLLAGLPPLLALIVANVAPVDAGHGPGLIHARATFLLLLQVVVPLGSLLVASGLIADEVEGRTITYLFTRATPRAAVLLGRVAAVLALLVPLFALSAWATALAAAQRPGTTYPEAVQRMIMAAAAGALVYSLIGAVLGVLFRRALVVALAYAFAIEGFIANVPGSTARLAVQYWLRSLAIDFEVAPWSRMHELRGMVKLVEHDVAAVRLALIALGVLLFGVLMVRRRQYVLTS
jgi:ABC-type transport system involved in multi-copper enzyme maturation permease subunit